MSDLARRVASLSPEKIRALQAQIGRKSPKAATSIPRQPRDRRNFPLSYAQEMIWFLHQLAPESAAYNNCLTARVITAGGSLNPVMIEQGINALVRRHESMRTTFHAIDGEPVQTIHDDMKISVGVVDLTGVAPEVREEEALRRIRDDYRRPFDIERGPLMRLSLVQLSETESIITYATHHLISDGWSQGILLKENSMMSAAVAMGLPSPLPELPIQYADYAVWQREWLAGPKFQEMLAYWRRKLAGPLPVLQLPADRPRPATQDFEGRTVYRTLPAKLAGDLRSLAKGEGASLFMTLLAGLKALFQRYTGEGDVVVGSPIANRTRPEVENLYGFFVNTLALRTTVDPRESFRELLAKERATCEEAFANQEMPFEKLVETLAPQRDPKFSPICQTMFALQNAPLEVKAPGVTLVPMRVANDTAKFDVTLWAEELESGELLLSLAYRTALFDEAPMTRMLEHYENLLAAFAAQPDARLSSLPLERVAYPAAPAVEEAPLFLDRFAESVATSPDAIAVTAIDGALTYAELDRLSGEIAAGLDVDAEDLVAVIQPRSAGAIATMLGVMKAGAAYLPIDPDLPQERIAALLEIARPRVVLRGHTIESASPRSRARVTGERLAYVIFTSGSTGQSKPVGIEHRQLGNYLDGILATLRPGRGVSFASVSTLAADLGHTMIFPALATGGTLQVVPQECITEPRLLAEWFDAHPADFLKIVPSHLEALLATGEAARILPRRAVVLGGEALTESLVSAVGAGIRILNHYGPTETTVGVLTHDVNADRTVTSNLTLPIGRPLRGSAAYVVDEELNLLPDGIPGELLIGGAGVGRGYLGRPDQTAERFLPDPFSGLAGARLYRTGDRVRRLTGGAIQFLGRVDHQVKIRGHRVELGEIESALRAHPSVADAVVIVRGDGSAKSLAAWVASPAGDANATALRTHLRTLLPEPMVPAAFVVLDALPLNANGKVDRRALPEPESEARDASSRVVAPRNSLELAIAKVWEEMIGVSPIGVTDNFFDVGGHSLLAVRVAARLQKELKLDVPVATMFQAGTIEALARALGNDAARAAVTTVVPIQPQGSNAPLFFVHPAGGNVLCYYDLARQLGNDQPFFGLQVADFAPGREHRSIEQMASEYIDAMREVQPEGPYYLGGWSMGGVVAFEMARQLEAAGQTAAMLAILDMSIPLGNVAGASESLDDEARAIAIYTQKIELFSGMRLGVDYEEMARLDPAARVARFARELHRTGLVPEEIGADALGRFLAFQQGHSRVTLQYQPSRIQQRVTLIRGSEKLELRDQVELRGLAELHDDRALGWQPFTDEEIDVHHVPGNHITMMTRPNVTALAATLAAVVRASKERALVAA